MPQTHLSLTGLNCASCVSKVEKALLAVPGANEVRVSLADRSALVEGGVEPASLVAAIEAVGFQAKVINDETWQFSISTMNCASCVGKIEAAIEALSDSFEVAINLADKTVQIKGAGNVADILVALEKSGYPARLVNQQEEFQKHQEQEDDKRYRYLLKHTAIALGLGLPLMFWGLITGEMSVNSIEQQLAWGVVGIATLLVLMISGKHYFTGMWRMLKHGSTNMDTLVATGTGVAWLYSMVVVLFPDFLPANARHVYFEASAMIIGLINLGHALELRAKGKAGKAIKRLLGLQPKTARIVRDGSEVDIPVEQVAKGDRLRVRPGEKIAVDGVVLEGETFIDESMLTGEPMPVRKESGEVVSAGTINKNGTLLYRAEKVGSDTTLAQIIALVKTAQSSKLPISRLADKISSIFVPVVMLIALVSAVIWFNFGPEPRLAHGLVVATTVLIIACPCALGLATPMSVMVGVGKAAELGILVRQGDALQKASKLTTVVLDKTGTITEGNPKVTDIVIAHQVKQRVSNHDLLKLAASLEAGSEHPLAEAIMLSARNENIKLSSVSGFQSITGLGVSGQVDNQAILLGNEALMVQYGLNSQELADSYLALARQGKTPMFMAVEGEVVGIIAVADPVREDSAEAIRRLHQQGITVVMLTGDNAHTAEAVAQSVGVDQFFAEVRPEDKDEHVRVLQDKGEKVGMTGDGINDAPALARADVGFAMGAGTDVAIESADITLMRSSLHGVADSIELSKATLKNIKQNLLGAFVYNSLGIPVAAGLFYPLTGMLLNPVIGGAAMALSSITVVSNANRLRLFKPEYRKEA